MLVDFLTPNPAGSRTAHLQALDSRIIVAI